MRKREVDAPFVQQWRGWRGMQGAPSDLRWGSQCRGFLFVSPPAWWGLDRPPRWWACGEGSIQLQPQIKTNFWSNLSLFTRYTWESGCISSYLGFWRGPVWKQRGHQFPHRQSSMPRIGQSILATTPAEWIFWEHISTDNQPPNMQRNVKIR